MPRSILTVLTAPTIQDLTTLEVAKEELGIKGASKDGVLRRWISEASADVQDYLGRKLGLGTYQEMWRHIYRVETLRLSRHPLVALSSLVIDGCTIDAAEIEIDAGAGLLRHIEPHGCRLWHWNGHLITATYSAGYDLLTDLPRPIEVATLMLLKHRYALGDRDPTVKAESVPGILETQYWVGAQGDNGAIPPEVAARLDAYMEVRI